MLASGAARYLVAVSGLFILSYPFDQLAIGGSSNYHATISKATC